MSRRAFLLATGMVLAAAAPAAAERKPELKFLTLTELPAIGLKIRLMPECQEMPPAPPAVFTYTFTREGRQWREELYAPLDLWRRSQHAGLWTDKQGNRLVLASITDPLPKEFSREHVSREEFDGKIQEGRKLLPPWTGPTLAQWASDFAGGGPVTAEPVAKPPAHMTGLTELRFPRGVGPRFAYAFRLNPASTGQWSAPQNWFFVMVDVSSFADPDRSRDAVLTQMLGTLTVARTPPPRPTLPEIRPSSPLKSPSGKPRSPEFLASRAQVIESIRNLNDWWYDETENYIFLSNMKSRYRVLFRDLETNIEKLRAVFQQFVPPVKDITAVSVIRIFGAPEEYEAYVGAQLDWSGGLWVPSRKELVVKPIDWGGTRDQRERIFQTTYHEAFHQYLFYALDQTEASAWFNEGHAQFFSNVEFRNTGLAVREDEMGVPMLLEILKPGPPDLQAILNLSYEQFYAQNSETRRHNYALTWGLVYYLRRAAPPNAASPYPAVPGRYVKALSETRDSRKATELAFQGVNLPLLAADFAEFWKSRNRRGAAERAPFPPAAR